jgi:hypothetical protein
LDFATRVSARAARGTKIFIRYASEMNGNWFRYGQQPAAFLDSWKKFVTAVRTAAKTSISNIAFVWAPNTVNEHLFTLRAMVIPFLPIQLLLFLARLGIQGSLRGTPRLIQTKTEFSLTMTILIRLIIQVCVLLNI